jgi:hypothetical protein
MPCDKSKYPVSKPDKHVYGDRHITRHQAKTHVRVSPSGKPAHVVIDTTLGKK